MEDDRKNEEGDPLAPIGGELEANFAGLEKEQNRKLRNKIIMWVGITIGVIVVVTVIIIIALNSGAGKKDEEKPSDSDSDTDTPEVVPGDVVGNIKCTYNINQGDINILSEDFENKNNVAIFIGDKQIVFNKKHKFLNGDNKTVRFELHGDSFSFQNMFKNVDKLKIVNIIPETTKIKAKITSFESAFEGTKALTEINFLQGFDYTQLTSMKNMFAFSNIKDIQLNNITLENVVDMSLMFRGSKILNFSPGEFNAKSVKTMQSMFQDSYNLEAVIFPNFDSNE